MPRPPAKKARNGPPRTDGDNVSSVTFTDPIFAKFDQSTKDKMEPIVLAVFDMMVDTQSGSVSLFSSVLTSLTLSTCPLPLSSTLRALCLALFVLPSITFYLLEGVDSR